MDLQCFPDETSGRDMCWGCLLPAVAGSWAYSRDTRSVQTTSIQPSVHLCLWLGSWCPGKAISFPALLAEKTWLQWALTLHDALTAMTVQNPRASTAQPCQQMKTKIHRKLWQCGCVLGEQRGGGWKNSFGVMSPGARKQPSISVKDEQGPAVVGSEELAARRGGTFCTFCSSVARGADQQPWVVLPGIQFS